MSLKVTLVTGSVRPNSAGKGIVKATQSVLVDKGYDVQVADLAEIGMPFFDSEIHPAQPDYIVKHESVQKWQEIVQSSEVMIFLTPEYNHQMTPVQMNAIDWLYADWKNKPVGILNYGHSGAPFSGKLAKETLAYVGARVAEYTVNLSVTEGDFEFSGHIKNEKVFVEKIDTLASELKKLSTTSA